MQTKLIQRLTIVIVPTVLTAALFALTFARLFYSTPNPYARYLSMTPAEVRSFASCYSAGYAAYISRYCLYSSDAESVNFSLDDDGHIQTVGIFRQSQAVLMGDLWAWYGAPDRVNVQTHWAAYYWHGTLRILATARSGSPYARVTFVHFTLLQTDFETALP